MLRVDLHIVRTARGWLVQNAEAKTLQTFRDADAAIQNGEARARQLQARGLNVRLTIHYPGKKPQSQDFPASTERVESYALARCGLC
jgi:hypothetical protein